MSANPEQQKISTKKVSKKPFRIFHKKKQRNMFISTFLLFVLLLLVVFVQKPQVILERAATGSQNNCASVPYYCLILGGKKTCTRPPACPPSPVPPGFTAQAGPALASHSATPISSGSANLASGSANLASGSANLASSSAQTTCSTPPSLLTTKQIIHFDTDAGSNNGYTIRATDMPLLNSYATELEKYPTATVTINGYTDSVAFDPGTPGPINNNQALSVARAQAAEDYLKSKGATANTYVIKGNGATNYVAKNDPKTGNLLNRRDEITTNLRSGKKVCTTTASPTCTDNGGNWGFGGYTFSVPTDATKASVSTQWDVVATTCSAGVNGFSVWPGIQTNDKLVQTGSYDSCPGNGGNTLTYFPWTMAYPGPWVNPPSTDTIKPGDTMFASITMTSKGHFTTVLRDTTKGWSFSVTTTDKGYKSLVSGTGQGQFFIEDEGTEKAHLPPFNPNPINFMNSQFSINGSASASLATAPGLACLNIARSGTIMDQVGSLSGGSFIETWKHL